MGSLYFPFISAHPLSNHCMPDFYKSFSCLHLKKQSLGYKRRAALAGRESCSRMRELRCELGGGEEREREYMQMCVSLARKALGCTSPNPMVGCIILKEGHIVGQGYHPKAGEPHAEIFALMEAGEKANESTVYVSLEPCNHYGRTPPCTQALIKAQVKRVVVGMLDPNPLVAGRGVTALKEAGIEVTVGVEEEICRILNEAYAHHMLTKRPFTTLRYSMSLDGCFLGSTITDDDRGYYSKLLQEYDAIVVTDAALSDNPILLNSEPGARQPLRVVVAHSLDLPLHSDIFDTSIGSTLVLTDENAVVADVQSSKLPGCQCTESLLRQRGVDVVVLKELSLDSILDVCYHRGLCSVLLDSRGSDSSGQQNVLGKQAIEEGVVQKVVVNVLPVLCGANGCGPGFPLGNTMLNLERLRTSMYGKIAVFEAYVPSS